MKNLNKVIDPSVKIIEKRGDYSIAKNEDDPMWRFTLYKRAEYVGRFRDMEAVNDFIKWRSHTVLVPLMIIVILFALVFPVRAEISQADGVRAIMGEARGQSYANKVAIGEALRNREKLAYYRRRGVMQGVYGYKTQFSAWPGTWSEAERAWKASAKSNTVKGAQYWFDDRDMKVVTKAKWFKNLRFVTRVGDHSFYKEAQHGKHYTDASRH